MVFTFCTTATTPRASTLLTCALEPQRTTQKTRHNEDDAGGVQNAPRLSGTSRRFEKFHGAGFFPFELGLIKALARQRQPAGPARRDRLGLDLRLEYPLRPGAGGPVVWRLSRAPNLRTPALEILEARGGQEPFETRPDGSRVRRDERSSSPRLEREAASHLLNGEKVGHAVASTPSRVRMMP